LEVRRLFVYDQVVTLLLVICVFLFLELEGDLDTWLSLDYIHTSLPVFLSAFEQEFEWHGYLIGLTGSFRCTEQNLAIMGAWKVELS